MAKLSLIVRLKIGCLQYSQLLVTQTQDLRVGETFILHAHIPFQNVFRGYEFNIPLTIHVDATQINSLYVILHISLLCPIQSSTYDMHNVRTLTNDYAITFSSRYSLHSCTNNSYHRSTEYFKLTPH